MVYQDSRGDLNIRHDHAYKGVDPNLRSKLFFLILLLLFPSFSRVSGNGYGEDSDSLGQFVDDFENENYVSVKENITRNSTLNAMELNSITGISYGDYTYNFEINIKSDRINSNLTDFPVLIKISDSSGITNRDLTGIFDEIENSYQKIAITDSSLSFEYYIEVEQWSLTDELGALWISVNVSILEDINLYLHYDSEVANNTDHVDIPGSLIAQNVWDDNFIAVYHMSDETTSTILDSTDSNLDGVKTAANRPEEINGLVGLGQEFDPIELVNLDTYPGVYTTVTMESWFQADDTDNSRTIFFLGEPDNQIDRISQNIGNDRLFNYFRTDGVTINPWITFTDEVNYYYFATTRIGTATKGYLDGVYDAGFDGVVGTGTIQDLRQTWIGAYSLGGNNFDGSIDECRFSNIVRIPEYFNATYFGNRDNLVEYGPLSLAGGYSENGYFTTTDYLLNTNGSVLVQLTNTSIPEDTDIKIQFSIDNASWVNNDGNAGSNDLPDGFFALDLRNLNWSTSYYLRYNFTGTSSITPRLYQSRLITTEDGVGEGPGPGITVVESDAPWVALAIILSIIAGLLVWGSKNE